MYYLVLIFQERELAFWLCGSMYKLSLHCGIYVRSNVGKGMTDDRGQPVLPVEIQLLTRHAIQILLFFEKFTIQINLKCSKYWLQRMESGKSIKPFSLG